MRSDCQPAGGNPPGSTVDALPDDPRPVMFVFVIPNRGDF